MHDLTGFGAGSGRTHRLLSWALLGLGALLLLLWALLALPPLWAHRVGNWAEWGASTAVLLGLAGFSFALNPVRARYYRAYGTPTSLVVDREGVTLQYDGRGETVLPWKDADRWFFLTDQSRCLREDLWGPFPSDFYLNTGRGATWLTQAAFEEILNGARAAGVAYVMEVGKASSVWASGFLRGKIVYYARPNDPERGGPVRGEQEGSDRPAPGS